jgi:hypothetical protein
MGGLLPVTANQHMGFGDRFLPRPGITIDGQVSMKCCHAGTTFSPMISKPWAASGTGFLPLTDQFGVA